MSKYKYIDMYLIVSATNKYKGEIKFNDDVINANTVGHEIHITRPILMILLSMNLITTDDIIVTRNNERFFLYSNIFKNIIGYDDLPSDIDQSQLIDITQANMWFHGKADIMHLTTLEKHFPIMSQIRMNKNIRFRNEHFNSLIRNIHFKDCSDSIKSDFVIIHHRIVNYNNSINYTSQIISSIQSIDPNLQIIIFSIEKPNDIPSSVLHINDLSTYASLMHNDKCKLVISEFSGAGQLSQYCHRRKIFYFCKTYHFYPGQDITNVMTEANQDTNIYDKFDCKIFTDASVYVFSNINSLLDTMKKYYYDTKYLRI